MLKNLFSFCIARAKFVLFVSLCFVCFFSFFAKDLQVDASADSLLLEDDKDLLYFNEVSKRYKSDDFIMIAVQPSDENPFSQESLFLLTNLHEDLEKISGVERVLSIINAPLLQSNDNVELRELLKDIPNLQSKDINLSKAQTEIQNSPFYKKNIISPNGKTTALIVYLKGLGEEANILKKILKNGSSNEKSALVLAYEKSEQEAKFQSKTRLESIRAVLEPYKTQSKGIYIGGVSVVANDMISYIKDDLFVYGVSLTLLLAFVLWVFFKGAIFVGFALFVCLASLSTASGIFALLGFKITVISSNYLAFMLIITMSLVIHLMTHYIHLSKTFPHSSGARLALATLLAKTKPSFYAILTTAIGFLSLIFSNIEPIMKLGTMMSIGISLSLLISFAFFASVFALSKKSEFATREPNFGFLRFCANLALTRQKSIYSVSVLLLILAVFGIKELRVENSFVSYFKDNSEIKQGLLLIDKELGGTMPLELILHFPKQESVSDEFESFESEFEVLAQGEQYFFSADKIRLVKQIHNYLENKEFIGSVLSFNSLLELGKGINEGKDLDDFALAFLYENIPPNFKQDLLSPFVNIEQGEFRFVMRVLDSNENLRRNAFIKEIQSDVSAMLEGERAKARISGIMLLYNNMLQSLFTSQFNTLGFVVAVIFMLFVFVFASFRLALVALLANVVPLSVVFCLMGFWGLPLDLMSITIAAICIGIGVDDSIHYIYKFKQVLAKGRSVKEAIYQSQAHIGMALFHSKIAIILGFSVMMSSNFIPTIYFGFLTLLVMILLLLGSLILLPSLLSFKKA